jgi:hypothetical protein
MWKPVLAGTIAVVVAGSSLVYAQQRPGRQDNAQSWRPNMEDMRAFGEARLAALKAGLALTPEQEKLWPAFESAARDLQKLRLDRANAAMAARRDSTPQTLDPAARMSRQATAMTETGAALKKLADATDPLYKSLDDGQKRRFAMLGRMMHGHGGPGQHFRGRDRDGGPRMGERRRSEGPMMPDHGMRGPGMPGHDMMPGRRGMMPGGFEPTIGTADGAERL